jgi:hypothetical protein
MSGKCERERRCEKEGTAKPIPPLLLFPPFLPHVLEIFALDPSVLPGMGEQLAQPRVDSRLAFLRQSVGRSLHRYLVLLLIHWESKGSSPMKDLPRPWLGVTRNSTLRTPWEGLFNCGPVPDNGSKSYKIRARGIRCPGWVGMYRLLTPQTRCTRSNVHPQSALSPVPLDPDFSPYPILSVTDQSSPKRHAVALTFQIL